MLPVAVGRSQIKVSGKIKFADGQPRFVRDFIGGANNSLMASGQTEVANNEPQSVPASSSYTVTVNNSATFGVDLGVSYAATGIKFTLVSSLTAAGQYTYAAGVYTFYSADASAAVLISYTYTVSTSGATVTLSNTAAGAANTFQMITGATFQGLQTNIQLYACVPESLNLFDTKIGDFNMLEEDYSCFVNSAGNLGIISLRQGQQHRSERGSANGSDGRLEHRQDVQCVPNSFE